MSDRRLPASANAPQIDGTRAAAKSWGVGRVAFFARIDEIRAELAQGWPLTTVYARHKHKLGITYSGFRKLVARHAADARPMSARASDSQPMPVRGATAPANATVNRSATRIAVPPPGALTPAVGSSPHAGHQPARTFVHDPVERPGDYERLFGARRR